MMVFSFAIKSQNHLDLKYFSLSLRLRIGVNGLLRAVLSGSHWVVAGYVDVPQFVYLKLLVVLFRVSGSELSVDVNPIAI